MSGSPAQSGGVKANELKKKPKVWKAHGSHGPPAGATQSVFGVWRMAARKKQMYQFASTLIQRWFLRHLQAVIDRELDAAGRIARAFLRHIWRRQLRSYWRVHAASGVVVETLAFVLRRAGLPVHGKRSDIEGRMREYVVELHDMYREAVQARHAARLASLERCGAVYSFGCNQRGQLGVPIGGARA